jgi:iron(III) transport system substrate-binding protein
MLNRAGRRPASLTLVGALSLVLVGCGSGGGASTPASVAPSDGAAESAPPASDAPAAGRDQVCADAAAEETLEVWLNFGNYEPIVDDFRAAYPEIDIEAIQISPEDAVPRIVTEAAAGQPITPDVQYGNIGSLAPLIERELVEPVDWVSLGVREDLTNDANVVRVAVTAYGVGFNTTTHTADDLPDTWEGFIDPAWGPQKLLLDPRGRPFSFLSLEWGTEATVDYVERLIETTDPIVFSGTTAGLVAIAAGEAEVLLNSKTAETREQVTTTGAPLEIKLLDIVPVEGTQLLVTKDPTSPNAAQCFVAWAASDEGSASILEHDFKTNDIESQSQEGSINLTTDSAEAAAIVDETITALQGIIGQPVNE